MSIKVRTKKSGERDALLKLDRKLPRSKSLPDFHLIYRDLDIYRVNEGEDSQGTLWSIRQQMDTIRKAYMNSKRNAEATERLQRKRNEHTDRFLDSITGTPRGLQNPDDTTNTDENGFFITSIDEENAEQIKNERCPL